MSAIGRWAGWYEDVSEPVPYGLTVTYELGAAFLADCALVEDWGCGTGWMRQHFPEGRYVGLDGTASAHADRVVDLECYASRTPGIFMRHVLEHNYEWRRILQNACKSFTQRFVLVLFTPLVEETREVAFVADPGVPDIAFALADITAFLDVFNWRCETLPSETAYGEETIFYVERRRPDSVA